MENPTIEPQCLHLLNLVSQLATITVNSSKGHQPGTSDILARLQEIEDLTKDCRLLLSPPPPAQLDLATTPTPVQKPSTESTETHTCVCEARLCGSDNISSPSTPSQSQTLPEEAISRIFELSTIPDPFLDPLSALVPKSLWSERRRRILALSYVCRDWHSVGAWFLYDHICISRVQQLPLLVRTLVNNPEIRPYVNTITFCPLIEPWQQYDAFACLGVLFSLCSELTTFNGVSMWPLPKASVLPPPPPQITHLKLDDNTPPEATSAILNALAKSLQSLSISGVFKQPNPLHFPELTRLTLGVTQQSIANLDDIQTNWSCPKLLALTLHIHTYDFAKSQDALSTHVRSLCSALGGPVAYLHIYTSASNTDVIKCLDSDLLSRFPLLIHLVLPPRTVGDLSHPKVQFIDLWTLDSCYGPGSEMAMCEWEETYSKLNKNRFPSLQGRRTLPRSMMHLQNLALDIHPATVPTKRSRPLVFDYEGLCVQAEFGRVVVREEEWDEEEDSDSGSYPSMGSDSDSVERDGEDDDDDTDMEIDQADNGDEEMGDDGDESSTETETFDLEADASESVVSLDVTNADALDSSSDMDDDDDCDKQEDNVGQESESSDDEDYEYWEESQEGGSTGSDAEESGDLEFSGLWHVAT